MASSLQRMKKRSDLERDILYWYLFCSYYKGTRWRYDYFTRPFLERPKFRKRSTLEKFYNLYYK